MHPGLLEKVRRLLARLDRDAAVFWISVSLTGIAVAYTGL